MHLPQYARRSSGEEFRANWFDRVLIPQIGRSAPGSYRMPLFYPRVGELSTGGSPYTAVDEPAMFI